MENREAERQTRPGWSILLSLIIFYPVGLVLMWKYARWTDWQKTLVTVFYALWTLWFLTAIVGGPKG